jgi:hypothetical protein
MADQETINARLPVGTRVKGVKLVYFAASPSDGKTFGIFDQDGILLRHGRELGNRMIVGISMDAKEPAITTGWQDIAIVQFFNQDDPREVDFDALIYLIDGQWKTFDEVMALP